MLFRSMPATIPNGDIIPVKGIGSSILPNGLMINGVLHIPDFRCNLLSVSRITKELNCSLTFFPNFCVIQDLHSRTLIGVGKCSDGLYYVEPKINKGVAMTVAVSTETWHRRLGHAPYSKLRELDFLGNFVDTSSEPCDSCLRAQQTRLSFSDSSIKTISCFDLLHCDIWGPYRVPSFSAGAKYFLSIVDDFSRAI